MREVAQRMPALYSWGFPVYFPVFLLEGGKLGTLPGESCSSRAAACARATPWALCSLPLACTHCYAGCSSSFGRQATRH
jgi:hypothetical protein